MFGIGGRQEEARYKTGMAALRDRFGQAGVA
jgi:hypothetical protein